MITGRVEFRECEDRKYVPWEDRNRLKTNNERERRKRGKGYRKVFRGPENEVRRTRRR